MKTVIALLISLNFVTSAFAGDLDSCQYGLNSTDSKKNPDGTLTVNGKDYECKLTFVLSELKKYNLCKSKDAKAFEFDYVVNYGDADSFIVAEKILKSGGTSAAICDGIVRVKQTRCGWIENYTPANKTLIDADDIWTVATQGDHSAVSSELVVAKNSKEFVATNGDNYGFYCGCMDGLFDKEYANVEKIYSFEQKKLSACSSDQKLPPMGE